MVHNDYCAVCDGVYADAREKDIKSQETKKQREELSFAVLLALVPAMTMTLFDLIGLI